MAKRGRFGGTAAAGWIAAVVAALAPGIVQAHGAAPPRAPAGWVEHTPRLSDFPRLHERARSGARPLSGHRPKPGRAAHERRRLLAVPAAVPVYSYYGGAWPDGAPPAESPPPETIPWSGLPPPPPAVEPLPRAVAAVTPAPETPIYYCSEINGYTNDLKLLQCPGRWQRVSP